MPAAALSEITFSQLQAFLASLGFDRPAKVNRSHAFCHRSSGVVLIVTVPAKGERVRPADLLSILVRLENEGLANESQLDLIRLGQLPKAS